MGIMSGKKLSNPIWTTSTPFLLLTLFICSFGQSQITPRTFLALANSLSSLVRNTTNVYRPVPGDTILHRAATLGQTETVRQLVQNGEDVNALNSRMESPLHRAALFPNKPVALDMIEILLDNGAAPYQRDNRSHNFLHNVVELGTTIGPTEFQDLTEDLIDRGIVNLFNSHLDTSEGGESALQLAMKNVREVNTETLRLLRNNEVSFNDEDRIGDNVLTYAIMGGKNATVLSDLVELGADWQHVNEENRSLLHYAAYYGNPSSLNYLSDLGLNDMDAQDNRGYTPAHFSALSGDDGYRVLDTMRYLVRNGANVNIGDRDGVTPVEMVLRWGELAPGRDTLVTFLRRQLNPYTSIL